jgi:caspase domain-containing protein
MCKALVVGIDHYEHLSSLYGCVNDAHSVKSVLATHGDDSVNFDVIPIEGTKTGEKCSRAELKQMITVLFADDVEIALFYFAGHGHIEATGGYLLTSECKSGDDGLPLGELLTLANRSKARNNIIILDSCHSGIAGNPPSQPMQAELNEGLTILTASTADQYATEANGHGVFTTLFVDAMNGAAANLVGDITPGGVYAHIDQSLGPWEQRPVFKTNVKRFVSLRKVEPAVPLPELQRITEFFPDSGREFALDPSFEPQDEGRTADMPRADPENNRKFAILQKYNRVNLLVPVDAEHMWNAAMESKSCRLTVLGEHYRRLRANNRF